LSADAITGKKTIVMSYSNYDIDIRYKYQVELTGWPLHIPFSSPSQLTTSTALRAVRDALKTGICRWMPLSKESKEALVKRVESGEIAKKPRAARADKGVKRGPRARGKENIPPSTKTAARARAVRSVPPSAPMVPENSDEDLD
jgi:hypothetical protein